MFNIRDPWPKDTQQEAPAPSDRSGAERLRKPMQTRTLPMKRTMGMIAKQAIDAMLLRSGPPNCIQACRAPSPAKISQSGVTSRLRTDDNQKARGDSLDSSSIWECRTTLHGKPRKLFLLHSCFKKSRFARKWYHRQQSRHKEATAFGFGIHQFSRPRLRTWLDQPC